MAFPNHLFTSDVDGHLYDTRDPKWSEKPPLRRDYSRTFPRIETAEQLKASLRSGGHVWPGGYPLYFVMADCEAMSFEAVRANVRECLFALLHPEQNGRDWRPVAIEINYEDSDLTCAHSGAKIPAAYSDD